MVVKKSAFDHLKTMAETDDPVELHILYCLDLALQQNKRLREYVERSGVWAELKKIDKWKPFDFYHYFCNLYEQKYRKAYRLVGSVVRAYQNIEVFISKNGIGNDEYKEFIEYAFARHFNQHNIPVIASICSASLYNRLMERNVKHAKTEDWFDLDITLQQESEAFDNQEEEEDLEYLDSLMAKEAEAFK